MRLCLGCDSLIVKLLYTLPPPEPVHKTSFIKACRPAAATKLSWQRSTNS